MVTEEEVVNMDIVMEASHLEAMDIVMAVAMTMNRQTTIKNHNISIEQYMTVLERYAAQQVAGADFPWSGPMPYSSVLMAMEVASQGLLNDYQGMMDRSNLASKTFINIGDTSGNTALHHAVLKRQRAFVKYLLEAGAQVDAANKTDGQTPLHWACVVGGDVQIVRMLVEGGADTSRRDNNGYNALLHAAQYNEIHSVRYLLDVGGVHLHSTDNQNHTALHWACYQGHSNMGRYLVCRGIDVNCVDSQGRTPLHWACHKGHKPTLSMLCSLGADRTIKDRDNKTASDLAAAKNEQDIVDFLKSKDRDDVMFSSTRNYNYFWIAMGVLTLVVPIVLMKALPFLVAAPAIGLFGYFFWNYLLAHYWIPENNNSYNATLLFASVAIWYLLYLTTLAGSTFGNNIIPHILINPQMWFFFYFFVKLVFEDAGAVNKYSNPETSTKVFVDALNANRPLPIVCPTCLINRPIRSKHCPSCNKCHARFDHHCIWINNCVAANNQVLFISLVFNYVLVVFSDVLTSTLVLDFGNDAMAPLWTAGKWQWIAYFYSNYTASFFFLIYGPILGIWIGKLGLSQIITILVNKTTYEQISERREMGLHGHSHQGAYEAPKEKDGLFHAKVDYNAFNRGKMNNLKEFLFDIKKYYYLMDLPYEV
eukprot:gene5917-6849_t